MGPFKSIFGLMRTIVPVVYCGGLVWYFLDLSGSVEDAKAIGLWPTLVGLSVVGLLFCIPLIFKIVWIILGLRSPRTGSHGDADTPGSGFDADAAIARFKAQRSADVASSARTTPAAPASGGPGQRHSFGRKVH